MSSSAGVQLPPSDPPTSLPSSEKGVVENGEPKEIKNELEFAQWYDTAGAELLEFTYEKYQSCLDELEMTTAHLDSLLRDSSSTLDLLSSLSRSFKSVEAQTTAFQQQCEGLLAAEQRSAKLADDIQENLQYYDYLDPASRKLNAPGAGNSVRRKDFSDMLRRLDECLDYMQAHRLNDIANAPSTSKDLVAFARTSISYIRGICLDEFDLWGQWFHGQQGLYDFLESVCEPLYDHLRPRIIHETQLVKLCQLCTLLQTRYLMDPEEEGEYPNPNQLDFSTLIQPALEDAQTRLVFRAQAILRDDIEKFKPKPEDLDYPARNRRVSLPAADTKGPATSGRKQSHIDPTSPLPNLPMIVDEELDSPGEKGPRWDFDSRSVFEGWYPTLRKAVWLLSRIYRLVNSTVFDDLAHQIVHQTTISLHQASTQIAAKSSPADAQLFLIKHLLILKQQIVAFDIEFVSPEVSFDFSGVTNTFWELRERGGLFNPRNLVRLLGDGLLPRVVENMLDAKAELDGRLRTVISDFTNSFSAKMTTPLPSNETSASQARGAIEKTCQAVQKEVPELRKVLSSYIDDTRTRETLVAAVRDSVIQLYEDFFEAYTSAETSSDRMARKATGKGRADEVWDVETFTEWSEGVFCVGISGLRGSEEDVEDSDDARSAGSV
ncbi:conserved oligomeric Golgi complex component 3 [Coccidioides immitis H538.4]|uniref:Conserved oligomeric Golgi complex component 3 n=1 Tax=Coccidioides immitis H538.4 TaxID=396776 RepID=A0A0J8RML8_COCIT|nr:conserved oligomeric Golgi complex component 3 [Coccidioides immitis H538.4]